MALRTPEEGPLSVYPVPADDWLYLDLPHTVEGQADIYMFDVLGQPVLTKHLKDIIPDQVFSVNVSALQEGTYILMLRGRHLQFIKQIVIMH